MNNPKQTFSPPATTWTREEIANHLNEVLADNEFDEIHQFESNDQRLSDENCQYFVNQWDEIKSGSGDDESRGTAQHDFSIQFMFEVSGIQQ